MKHYIVPLLFAITHSSQCRDELCLLQINATISKPAIEHHEPYHIFGAGTSEGFHFIGYDYIVALSIFALGTIAVCGGVGGTGTTKLICYKIRIVP